MRKRKMSVSKILMSVTSAPKTTPLVVNKNCCRRPQFKVLFCLLMLIGMNQTASGYLSGAGTVGNPYLISTPGHLLQLSSTTGDWSKAFRLVSNIDMIGVGFAPIGNGVTQFTGVFDGDEFTVSNLTINLTFPIYTVK